MFRPGELPSPRRPYPGDGDQTEQGAKPDKTRHRYTLADDEVGGSGPHVGVGIGHFHRVCAGIGLGQVRARVGCLVRAENPVMSTVNVYEPPTGASPPTGGTVIDRWSTTAKNALTDG
jgi:hypothetical protein